jgi:hypothetical protein
MKWLIATLVGAILALLVPAALSGPINDYFRSDRLVGTMEISPWQPNPATLPAQTEKSSGRTSLQEILAGVDDIQSKRNTFASLTLKNGSEEVINNIRVKFSNIRADALIDLDGEEKDSLTKGINEIKIAEMKQGDEITYRLWLDASLPQSLPNEIQTFSSSGKVRMRYKYPLYEFETEKSTIEWFLDEWAGFTVVILLLVLACVLGIVIAAYDEALKKILKDDAVYQRERDKYELDPAKYSALAGGQPPTAPP